MHRKKEGAFFWRPIAAVASLLLAASSCARMGFDLGSARSDGDASSPVMLHDATPDLRPLRDALAASDAQRVLDSSTPVPDMQPSDGGSSTPSPQLIYGTDLSGDGADDLIVLTAAALRIFPGGPAFSPRTASDAAITVLPESGCTFGGPTLLADANADGRTDLLLRTICGGAGSIAVITGPIALGVHAIETFPRRLQVGQPGIGLSRLGVGDFDGDGRADLVVSQTMGLNRSGVATGLALIYSNLSALAGSPTPTVTIEGIQVDGRFGISLEYAAGDVTGDGRHDLLVGADWESSPYTRGGAAYVFAGPLPPGTHTATEVQHSRYRGRHGNALFGVGSTMVDIDRDSVLDVVVGSDEDNGAGSFAGRALIYFGPVPAGTYSASDADRIVSGARNDQLGTSLRAHGDLDGDGGFDLLAWGCCSYDGDDRFVGKLFGVFARAGFASPAAGTADFVLVGDEENDRWGDAAIVGDVNSDGRDDFAVGLGTWNRGQGRVYVYYGRGDLPSGYAAASADRLITGPTTALEGFGSVIGQ